MIVVCPECARRYRIADAEIGLAGREVSCSACGAGWRAYAPVKTIDAVVVRDRPAGPDPVETARITLQRRERARMTPVRGFGWLVWAATAGWAAYLGATGPLAEALARAPAPPQVAIAAPDVEADGPDFVVRTRFANRSGAPAATPRLVFEAADADGRVLARWSARAPAGQIAPGATENVAVAVDPPLAARRLRVYRAAER